MTCYRKPHYFNVANLVEQVTVNHSVVGSSPTLEAKFIFSNLQPSLLLAGFKA